MSPNAPGIEKKYQKRYGQFQVAISALAAALFHPNKPGLTSNIAS
jgi:hypothetical protein